MARWPRLRAAKIKSRSLSSVRMEFQILTCFLMRSFILLSSSLCHVRLQDLGEEPGSCLSFLIQTAGLGRHEEDVERNLFIVGESRFRLVHFSSVLARELSRVAFSVHGGPWITLAR